MSLAETIHAQRLVKLANEAARTALLNVYCTSALTDIGAARLAVKTAKAAGGDTSKAEQMIANAARSLKVANEAAANFERAMLARLTG